ncbi:hypothetical protein OG705_00260 [Streptomyces sp. NBC_00838]|uniref:hypothetical protein n=1 Tax=Streptomyces sp. NBC_00838 TaxID=2903680 RepID=UPI0038684A56|nr:hypothetical protein OG705_00260 [Streptomyces sp. NBC_00838]
MTAPTSAAALIRLASRTFADDEPVYTAMSGQIPGVQGPVFGRIDEWPCDCLRRPANRQPSMWKCVFPVDPVWNLRAREIAFCMLGTVNHCMWNAPTAECQNQLPPAQRGQAPLLGACQPSRCRNSVLTLSHERVWRMEEADLVEFLKKKLSKPLRDQALTRLAAVRSATQHIDRLKEST